MGLNLATNGTGNNTFVSDRLKGHKFSGEVAERKDQSYQKKGVKTGDRPLHGELGEKGTSVGPHEKTQAGGDFGLRTLLRGEKERRGDVQLTIRKALTKGATGGKITFSSGVSL